MSHESALVFLTSNSATLKPEPADCKWIFPHAIVCALDENIYLGLQHVTLPVSWHVINRLNNVLTVDSVEYTLTIGDYNATTLTQHLNTLGTGLTFVLDAANYELTISGTAGAVLGGSALNVIGLDQSGATMPTSGQIRTERMDLSAGLHAIYLAIDIATVNIDTRSTSASRCLGVIPINANYGELLTYQTERPVMFKTSERSLSSIEIRLENSRGQLIPIGTHTDYEISIMVEKRKNPTLNKQSSLTSNIPKNELSSTGTKTKRTPAIRPEENQAVYTAPWTKEIVPKDATPASATDT